MGFDLINDSLIIGEGGAGTKILIELIKKNSDLNYSAITAGGNEYRYLDKFKDNLHNLIHIEDIDGTGKKPMVAFRELDKYKEEVDDMIKDYKFIFHLCGIGGGTGIGSAMNIARNNQKGKLHIFLGVVPHIKAEGQQIYQNTLDNIDKINKSGIGRLWLFDNNYTDDVNLYKSMNESIADEINYVFNLPSKNMITQDMDTYNLMDILFPTESNRKGIISMKKIKLGNFNSNINIDELIKRDRSVSYDLGFEKYDKVGLIVKLSDRKTFDDNKKYMQDMRLELIDKLGGADVHPAYYTSKKNYNEIILLLSNSIIRNKHYEKIKNRNEEMLNKFKENHKKEKEDEFNFSSSTSKREIFDSVDKEKDDPFSEEKEEDPFANPEDDFMDLFQ